MSLRKAATTRVPDPYDRHRQHDRRHLSRLAGARAGPFLLADVLGFGRGDLGSVVNVVAEQGLADVDPGAVPDMVRAASTQNARVAWRSAGGQPGTARGQSRASGSGSPAKVSKARR